MNFIKITLPKDAHVIVLEDSPMRMTWFKRRIPFCTVVDTIPGFKEFFTSRQICDFIFLDHDLGEGNGNGVDACKFLVERFGGNSKTLIVHSWNRPGAQRMQDIIPGAVHIPFGDFELEVEE